MILILDNIRSAHNVGSIFRTAEGVGVEKIYLCGHTPSPIDRFGRVRGDIAKTALGAAEMVRWEVADPLFLPETLKETGVTMVALEQTPDATSLFSFTPPGSVAYVVGNEVLGVTKNWLSVVDEVIQIPMTGQKESLNVAIATGIMLYHDYRIRECGIL